MARITDLAMTPMDCIIELSEGNPGACRVLADCFALNAKIDPDSALGDIGAILSFDAHEIYGSNIWVLFKDICGQSIHRVLALLRAVQLGFYSSARLRDEIEAAQRGRHTELTPEMVTALYAQVRHHLPAFAEEPAQ